LGFATGAAALGGELLADMRRENQSQYWYVRLLASGIETLRFYGFGNQSPDVGGSAYHRVTQQRYAVEPSAVWPLSDHVAITAGPIASWSNTSANNGRFIATLRDTLYGAREFGQVGGRLKVTMDARDKPSNARRGLLLSGEGRLYPAIWDATSAFGSAEGRAETYLSAPVLFAPTLALRAAGKKVWGRAPFYESAFLGGPSSLRGYYQQRFAGDASLSSSAELRLTLVRSQGLFPALWGIFGNTDAGRVYVDGRSPGGWHASVGGGAWVALLDRANTFSIGLARGSEQTLLYAGLGFPF
jgi:outer membrane protein assembly factor BamA